MAIAGTPATNDGAYRVDAAGASQVDAVRLRPVPLQMATVPGRAGDATVATSRAGNGATRGPGQRLGAHLDMMI